MPRTIPRRLSSGPPLLPGLIAASVWIIVAPSTSRRPLTMPRLTVFCRKPSGVPMAITSWPTRAYDETVAQLSLHADALDGQWKSFIPQCYQGRIVGGFDRPWFALWDTRAMQGTVASGCVPYFDDLRRRANDIRQAVAAADEAARRSDIFPGTRREVLRKYRLDYAGWNR